MFLQENFIHHCIHNSKLGLLNTEQVCCCFLNFIIIVMISYFYVFFTSEYQSMESFLSSGEVIFGKHLYIPLTKFVEQYFNYLSRRLGRYIATARSSTKFISTQTDIINRYGLVVKSGDAITVASVGHTRFKQMFGTNATAGIIYPMKKVANPRTNNQPFRARGAIVFGCNVFDDVVDDPGDTGAAFDLLFGNVSIQSRHTSQPSEFPQQDEEKQCTSSECAVEAGKLLTKFQQNFTGTAQNQGMNAMNKSFDRNVSNNKRRRSSLANAPEDMIESHTRVTHVGKARSFIHLADETISHLTTCHRTNSICREICRKLKNKRDLLVSLIPST